MEHSANDLVSSLGPRHSPVSEVNRYLRQAVGKRFRSPVEDDPFSLHVILPEQLRKQNRWTPERVLCLAVLSDAVDIINRQKGRPIEIYEALAWIQSADRSWAFSFENVCDQLNINPEAARERILRLDKRFPRRTLAVHKHHLTRIGARFHLESVKV